MHQSAAVMVMDHFPDDEEMEELAYVHLEALEEDEAEATVDVVYEAPEWMDVAERDQINAFMRDGATCIVVVYMVTGESSDD